MSENLAKSTGRVGVMTLLSRVLGFLRDMLAAQYFGAGSGYDAFLVAFKIPNFMRALFAEGAFAQAFIPLLSERQSKSTHQGTRIFIDHISGCLLWMLIIVTALGIWGAPVIVTLVAPGFGEDSDRFLLAVDMLRITFPYLLLISLTALGGSILNTHGRFGPPAFTPCLLNIASIAAMIILPPLLDEPVEALAWGVLLGGILQMFFQVPYLLSMDLMPRFKASFSDPDVRRLLKLLLPALFGVAVVQVNVLMSTIFASFLQVGSVSWLYYADRLMQFPLGVFGVALATVVLPNLSRGYATESPEAYTDVLDWSLRAVLLLGLPAALGLYYLAEPLVVTLFNYRAFTVFDATQTYLALQGFAPAIFAFIALKILASAFYARQNIKTPVKVAAITLVANALLSLILMQSYQHVGLAWAVSLSALLNAVLLLSILLWQKIYVMRPGWGLFSLRLLCGNVSMIAILWAFMPEISLWLEAGAVWRVMWLSVLIMMGAMTYVLVLTISGLRFRHIQAPQPV